MQLDQRVQEILRRVQQGAPPAAADCEYLLGFAEMTPEAAFTRATADAIARERTDNTGVLFGQIGLELFPCEADCQFCAFGKSHTGFRDKITLDEETIRQKVYDFTKDGDLYCLWLMTMDQYDLDYYLRALAIAREVAPPQTLIYTNVGDTSEEDFRKMKAAGADGVYHVVRLGEGVYTTITPERRRQTIENARRAGLPLQDCLEPVGPEHTPQQLVEHMFETIATGFDTAGVMKRTAVPGTVFASEISNARLAQIVAVNALACTALDPYPWLPVHEPDLISLTSGANSICAETGVNPRDVSADTSRGRGLDMQACRDLLWQAGFRQLLRGDGGRVPLVRGD